MKAKDEYSRMIMRVGALLAHIVETSDQLSVMQAAQDAIGHLRASTLLVEGLSYPEDYEPFKEEYTHKISDRVKALEDQ